MQLCNIRIPLICILAWGSFSMLSAQSNSESAQANRTEIMRAVETFFHAASTDDTSEFKSVIAPTFYLFDSGVRFNGDSMMAVIKQLHLSGKRIEWHVTNPDVHINGDSAWLAYVNNGTATDSSGTTQLQWLESAILVKESGKWKMVFLHSTLVSPKR